MGAHCADGYTESPREIPETKRKKNAPPAASAANGAPPPAKPKPKKLKGGVGAIFKGFAQYYKNATQDKIVECFDWSWASMTKSDKGKVLRAAKELRLVGIQIGDIPKLYKFCQDKFKDTHFGPNALASNYSLWLKSKESSAPKSSGERYTAEEKAILEKHNYDMYYLWLYRQEQTG